MGVENGIVSRPIEKCLECGRHLDELGGSLHIFLGLLPVLLQALVELATQLLRLSDLVPGRGVGTLSKGVAPHGEPLGESLATQKAVERKWQGNYYERNLLIPIV